MPVPAQNSCLREYVARNKGRFILPFGESNFPNCYHQLFGLVNEMEKASFLIMYSVLMLPEKLEKREAIYSKLKEKTVKICFVLENFSTCEYDMCEAELANYWLQRLACKESILKNRIKNNILK